MRPRDLRAARPSVLLAGSMLLLGCSVESYDTWSPPVYDEIEPNDSPWQPDFLGGVNGMDHFIVEGHVEAVGHDLVDHFEIVADEPVAIEFSLYGDNPYADLDLSLFDPDSGEIVAIYDGPWNPEEGMFTIDWAGKRVVLVVEAWVVDSSYSLELMASPHPFYGNSGPDEGAAAPTSGNGISFPDGEPSPSPQKHGPRSQDEELLVFAITESEGP